MEPKYPGAVRRLSVRMGRRASSIATNLFPHEGAAHGEIVSTLFPDITLFSEFDGPTRKMELDPADPFDGPTYEDLSKYDDITHSWSTPLPGTKRPQRSNQRHITISEKGDLACLE